MKALKFIFLSIFAIIIYFIPFNGTVPIVTIINTIKIPFGNKIHYISIMFITLTFIEFILSKFMKVERLKNSFKGEGVFKYFFYISSPILIYMNLYDVDNPLFTDPRLVDNALKVASNVFLTILIAGSSVILILKSGVVEFVSILVEPLIKYIFKLPGEAAIDIISSFVSSSSVGVYIASKHYEENIFTLREASALVTNFCLISIGYIAVLATLAGISEYYNLIVVSAFFLVMLIAIIMIRIWPISNIENSYHNKIIKNREYKNYNSFNERFLDALSIASQKSDEFTIDNFISNFKNSFNFARKTISIMVTLVSSVLLLVYYTDFFQIISIPIIPILDFFRVPNANIVAQSVMIGIVEISLPSILIGGTGVDAASRFFVVLLSICQVIFFSECGNAILSSKIKISAFKLVLIFLMRTFIAIPLVSLITQIIF